MSRFFWGLVRNRETKRKYLLKSKSRGLSQLKPRGDKQFPPNFSVEEPYFNHSWYSAFWDSVGNRESNIFLDAYNTR